MAFLLVRSCHHAKHYERNGERGRTSRSDTFNDASRGMIGVGSPVMPSIAVGTNTGLLADRNGQYRRYRASPFVAPPVIERSNTYSRSSREYADHRMISASAHANRIMEEVWRPIKSRLRINPSAALASDSTKQNLEAPSVHDHLPAGQELTNDEVKPSLSTSGPPEYALSQSDSLRRPSLGSCNPL